MPPQSLTESMGVSAVRIRYALREHALRFCYGTSFGRRCVARVGGDLRRTRREAKRAWRRTWLGVTCLVTREQDFIQQKDDRNTGAVMQVAR